MSTRPLPFSLFAKVAEFPHEYREDFKAGKKMHYMGCNRCALELQLKDLKTRIEYLTDNILRDVIGEVVIDEPRSDPKK